VSRRDVFLLIVAAIVIAGIALVATAYHEPIMPGAWREDERVDYV